MRATTHVCLAAAVGFLLAGCDTSTPPDNARPSANHVYSALLQQTILEDGWGGDPEHYDDRRPIELLVIVGEVSREAAWAAGDRARILPALDPTTVADFQAQPLEGRLDLKLEGVGAYQTLSADELTSIFDEGGWTRFYERFPASPGFVDFSRVGFGRDGTQALVYMGQLRDGLWGDGGLFLLERRETGWTVVDSATLWES